MTTTTMNTTTTTAITNIVAKYYNYAKFVWWPIFPHLLQVMSTSKLLGIV